MSMLILINYKHEESEIWIGIYLFFSFSSDFLIRYSNGELFNLGLILTFLWTLTWEIDLPQFLIRIRTPVGIEHHHMELTLLSAWIGKPRNLFLLIAFIRTVNTLKNIKISFILFILNSFYTGIHIIFHVLIWQI